MPDGRNLLVRLSLGRLFVYFTVICLVTGVVLRSPELVVATNRTVVTVLLAALQVVPTVFVCRWNASRSRNPRLSIFVTAMGALIGAYFCPGWAANAANIVVWLGGYRWGGLQPFGIVDMIIPPLAAAVVGGLSELVIRASKGSA